MPSAIRRREKKIEAEKAKETTSNNYYDDTRYKIGINIEPSQSDYHASARRATNRCAGR